MKLYLFNIYYSLKTYLGGEVKNEVFNSRKVEQIMKKKKKRVIRISMNSTDDYAAFVVDMTPDSQRRFSRRVNLGLSTCISLFWILIIKF